MSRILERLRLIMAAPNRRSGPGSPGGVQPSAPRVTIQVLPAIAHPANASGFVLAENAVWCEHVASGYVFTDPETVSALSLRFDTLRGECYRVSESLRMIERLGARWETGVSPLTRTATAGTA